MALYLPRRYEQPQGGGDIDWGNPITRGLSFCVIPSIGPIELVGRKLALNTNRIRAARAGGIGFESAGALTTLADAWVFPTKRGQRSALSSVFVGVVNSADAYPGFLASCDGSSTNLMRAIVHGLNDGGGLSNPDLSLTIHGNGWNTFSKVFTASGNFDAKKFVDVGQSRAHGFTWNKDKNSGYGRGFLQGIEVARTSGTAQTTVSDWDQSTAGGFIILANPSTTYGWVGVTQFFAVWERDLEPAEMQEMLANPWQIYKSRLSMIFTLPAASGTTYNDSLSEGVTLGESQASALTAGTALSEAVTLGSEQVSALVTAGALSEGVTLGDELAGGLSTSDAIEEALTVGDSYPAIMAWGATLTEGVALAADLLSLQTFVDTLSEGATLGESFDAGLLIEAVLAQSVTLSDDVLSSVTKDEAIAEGVTLGETFASALLTEGAVSEGVTLGDTVAGTGVYAAGLSEGITLDVTLVDEYIQGGVYNDTLDETLALDASFSATLVAGAVLAEGIVLDASFYTPPLGQSVRSGGGGGGGRAWGWELDREVEEEMGALLEGPPLTPATIEAVARRLDAPAESRIIGLKQPPVPAVSFEAAMVRRRRIRRRLLLLL